MASVAAGPPADADADEGAERERAAAERQATRIAFLKRNSSVPDKFIDDFFSMHDTVTKQTDFVVDLDKGAKWLRARKHKLFETLKRSYNLDEDYTVVAAPSRVPGRKYGGNRRLAVTLTPDCFKRMCMRTATARGEMVRTYYIDLEGIVLRFAEQELDKAEADKRRLQADKERLRAAARPASPKDYAGYIYVIRASETNDRLRKIGRTKNLVERLRHYRTGRSEGVVVERRYRTDNLRAVEACIKALLREHQYEKYREVYEADLAMIDGVAKRCKAATGWKQDYVRRRPSPQHGGGYYLVLDRGTD